MEESEFVETWDPRMMKSKAYKAGWEDDHIVKTEKFI